MNKKELILINKLNKRFPNSEFEYLDGYKDNTKTKCRFKCKNCGNEEYYTLVNSILNKRKSIFCNLCSPSNNNSGKDNFLKNAENDGFLVIGEYKNNKTPVKAIHKKCNKINYLKPNSYTLKTKCRCKYCNLSKNERDFSDFLDSLNIEYEIQYRIDEIRKMPYDFFIPRMNLLVEIDGKQHNKESWGDSAEFKRLKESEKIKEKVAKENKFALLRLPAFEGKVYLKEDIFIDNYYPRDCRIFNKEYIGSL